MMHRIHQDRRGIAAIEFALLGPVLLLVLGMMVDISLAMLRSNELAEATAAGGQYAFTVGATVTSSSLQSAVQSATALSGVTTVVTGPALYCSSGSPAKLTADPTGATCASGNAPGTYVIVTSSYTYQPLLPGLSSFVNTALQQSVTVRLQ